MIAAMSRINNTPVEYTHFSAANTAPVAPAAAIPYPGPSSAFSLPGRTGVQNLEWFWAALHGGEQPSLTVTPEEGRVNYKLAVRA